MTAILAAGASTRMGTPKLLLSFGQTTLIEHAINIAQLSNAEPTIVVTGAWHAEMLPVLSKTDVTVIYNPQWAEGQASSVRRAVTYCEEQGSDALILMVADQPFIRPCHLDSLIATYRDGLMDICVSEAEGRRGNPCLFGSPCFPALKGLFGDEGARQLLRSDIGYTISPVNLKDKRVFEDVDTPDDYLRISDREHHGII